MQRAADGAHDWQTSSHIVWGGWGGAGGMCRPAVVLLRLRWWLSRSASWAHPEADTDVGAETASKSGCIALTENRFTQSSNTPGPRVEHTPEPLRRPGRQSGSPAIRGRSVCSQRWETGLSEREAPRGTCYRASVTPRLRIRPRLGVYVHDMVRYAVLLRRDRLLDDEADLGVHHVAAQSRTWQMPILAGLADTDAVLNKG